MTAPMDIAILAHSTNPRGGVVHALELGDALVGLGHRATVHAPDRSGNGFFRPTLCATRPVPASDFRGTTTDMVEVRAADYVRYFRDAAHRRFDVFHAQDGISANALATLKDMGAIPAFARTVHHLDSFADPRLQALQERGITATDDLFVVSPLVAEELRVRYGRDATIVGNGVDRRRFSSQPQPQDAGVADRFGLPRAAPVFLAIGGVEARKNTLLILEAFCQVRRVEPHAVLVIAGGASVLDHAGYQDRFKTALQASNLPPSAVRLLGPVADQDMPSLYRLTTALVFPSVKEGFGLVVLEAMASGTPVITSRIQPFTGYLGVDDAVWCDPTVARTIAEGMLLTLNAAIREPLIASGYRVIARHDWPSVAQAHLPRYADLKEAAHA
jgi:glycosyltransferase-like protein